MKHSASELYIRIVARTDVSRANPRHALRFADGVTKHPRALRPPGLPDLTPQLPAKVNEALRGQAEHREHTASLPNVSNMVYRVKLKVRFDMRRVYLAFGHAEYHPVKFDGAKVRHDKVTCSVYRAGKIVITSSKTPMTAKANAHRYRRLVEAIPQPVALVRSPPGSATSGSTRAKHMEPRVRTLSNGVLYQAPRRELRTHLPNFTRFGLRPTAPFTFFDRAKVVNIVADGHLGTAPISLAGIFAKYREYVKWNPAVFTGLIVPVNRRFIQAHPELARHMQHTCTIGIFHTGTANITGAKSIEDVNVAYRFFSNLVRNFKDHTFPRNRADINEYLVARHKQVTDEHRRQFRKRRQHLHSVDEEGNEEDEGNGRSVGTEGRGPPRKRPRTGRAPSAPLVQLSTHERRALENFM